jgi:hypothetical protein
MDEEEQTGGARSRCAVAVRVKLVPVRILDKFTRPAITTHQGLQMQAELRYRRVD